MPFKKGISGNPNGRPTGSKNKFSIVELEDAIKRVEKKKKVSLYEHFIRRAFVNDTVLIALMRKLLPDAQYKGDQLDEEWLNSEIQLLTPKQEENARRNAHKFLS